MINNNDLSVGIQNRLKAIGEALKLNKTEISIRSGISRSFYSTVARGAQLPSFDFLVKICETFNISADYLVFGEGEMFRADNEFINGINPESRAYYKEIMKAIESKAPEDQIKLFKAIDKSLDLIK